MSIKRALFLIALDLFNSCEHYVNITPGIFTHKMPMNKAFARKCEIVEYILPKTILEDCK